MDKLRREIVSLNDVSKGQEKKREKVEKKDYSQREWLTPVAL